MRRSFVALASVLLVVGCAGSPTKPWSVVDGTDWERTDPYSYPVRIARIDAQDYLRESRRVVEPGEHVLRFESEKPMKPGRQYRDTREMKMTLAPCTHYWFYAKHPSKFSDDWKVVVLRQGHIEGCGG